MEGSLETHLEGAEVVFVGTVIRIGTDHERREQLFTFRVNRYYKGIAGRHLVVATFGSCPDYVERDGIYLVFAHHAKWDRDPSRLSTHQCSGNKKLKGTADSPVALGPGHEPLEE